MSNNRHTFLASIHRWPETVGTTVFLAMLFASMAGAQDKTRIHDGRRIRAEGGFAALVVMDLDASLQWYESNLNMRVVKRGRSPRVDATTVVLSGNNFFVELIHYDNPAPAKPPQDDRHALDNGIIKVGMILDQSDFDSLWQYLHRQPVSFAGGGGIFSDKEMGVRSFLVRDNGGNILQFFARIK